MWTPVSDDNRNGIVLDETESPADLRVIECRPEGLDAFLVEVPCLVQKPEVPHCERRIVEIDAVCGKQAPGHVGPGPVRSAWKTTVFRFEDYNPSRRQPAFTVAPPCGLHNAIQRAHRAEDDWKVKIDTCFNHLSGDQEAGLARSQETSHAPQNVSSMSPAQERGQVPRFGPLKVIYESEGVPLCVDDRQRLALGPHRSGHLRPRQGLRAAFIHDSP